MAPPQSTHESPCFSLPFGQFVEHFPLPPHTKGEQLTSPPGWQLPFLQSDGLCSVPPVHEPALQTVLSPFFTVLHSGEPPEQSIFRVLHSSLPQSPP